MDFRDALSAQMPAPRDDEPASLRQDIVDELGDHLACAYNRELLRNLGPRAAYQRALERFGDPAAVARRLWFDAMKGKIMAKRLLVATCLTVTIASLSLVGLVWAQSSRAAVQSAEANRKLAEALAQAQSTNKDMLNTLNEMSSAIRNARSLEWNPVKFTFTHDTPAGQPAAGFTVTLFVQGSSRTIVRTSDTSGIVDLGLLRPDEYTFQVSTPWDRRTLACDGAISVTPGSEINKRIICPTRALEPVRLRVRCNWPADLDKEGLVLDAPFHFMPVENDGNRWDFNDDSSIPTHSVLVGPETALTEVLGLKELYLWTIRSVPPSMTIFADILRSDVRVVRDPAEPMRWERGSYQLTQLIVMRPDDSPADHIRLRRFEVLAHCYPARSHYGVYDCREQSPTDEQMEAHGSHTSGGFGIPGVVLGFEAWSKVAKNFEALPDRPNEWTITLPDELIKAVREKIKKPANAQ